MSRGSIAVIEDDSALADLLADLLTEAGYEPHLFDGDRTTIRDLRAVQPDLVILDLILGGRDRSGWHYLRLIRGDRHLREVPVLICSADVAALNERRAQMLADPILTSISKPFQVPELEAAVAGLIAGQRAPTWDDESELVVIADHMARLVEASAALGRLLGVHPGDVRGRQVADIVAQTREWTMKEWQRYVARRRWEGPVTLRASDGRMIPAHAVAEVLETFGQTLHISRLQLEPADQPLVGSATD